MSIQYISQISGSAKSHFLLKNIGSIADLRVFAFVKDEQLNSFYEDMNIFFSDGKFEILNFPTDDVQERVKTADKIKTLNTFIVCASQDALDLPLENPNEETSLKLFTKKTYSFSDIIQKLIAFGYTKTAFVEDKLQFAVRGDIIDIWAAAHDLPFRIFFEYDLIETIKTFEPSSQLSTKTTLNEIKILSMQAPKNSCTIKDYFKHSSKALKTLLFFDYPLSKDDEADYSSFDVFINDPLNPKILPQGYKSFSGFQGDIKFFINSLKGFAKQSVNLKIFCANEVERERIINIFDDEKWNHKAPDFLYGNLSQSFYFEKEKLACVSSREMLYKKKPMNFPKIKGGRRIEGIWEINTGDLVVHEKYGIGRYKGLKTIAREKVASEYLCIEYKNNDKLYVPPEEMKTVQKYIGVEGVKPKLYSMDGATWERVKSRAKEEAAKFAKELLELYAQRSKILREPLDEETAMEKDLENAFPYTETPDQLKAIEDIKKDFARSFPMERLICGDVGYGKTEVALRAAFKMASNSKQCAVLSPTTVLAQQHFNTFSDRLLPFPVKLSLLSRFQTKSDQKKILEKLEKGEIDIVIGTHRLLQKDVFFKNLGLLIVDEEHRFGVKQKEKIKSIKKNVDILMLSATPIPRTLSSALSGFKDLSLIETPPFGRLPIETSLSLYDEDLIQKIISAELSRNGQVFYVYNRVETILTKAKTLKNLVPDARLGVIHGQMGSQEIEEVMWKFLNFELDILLATTIIESGLDIPSVNTMIIEEAEKFGLSQLYQLRGRIGRARKKAYCYLLYKDKNLSEPALKRLSAIKDFGELGSGFKLALKDLEIRGAGSILSASQHGFVGDIGYDMFAKMLEAERQKIKGEESPVNLEEKSVRINLLIKAFIPSTYIEDDDIRILFYRKLSESQKRQDIKNVHTELLDRFGKMPTEVENLFEVANLRLLAKDKDISEISEDKNYICLCFCTNIDLKKLNIQNIIAKYHTMVEFVSDEHFIIKLNKSRISYPFIDNLKEFLHLIDIK
ncbi:MAG: transcription-repair coupling factor [Elusimicrobiota bacterium]|jgi:transcription-repair coupling factor (superfamily II helicase)|nr:transcription-repair coupling factor [Elusimicrobiota bacterium]